jgi:uncharacterized protein
MLPASRSHSKEAKSGAPEPEGIDHRPGAGRLHRLVSTYEKDRGGDLVQPGAFGPTISRWKASGRPIPLHWNHQSSDPADIIGTVDPGSMRETAKGLVVEGELDLKNSARTTEAWRLVKADSVGVSFGYTAETERLEDGTRLLTSVDLFEVSLTPAPMNPDARVLDWKSATNGDPYGAEALGASVGQILSSKNFEAIRMKAERKRMVEELPADLVGTSVDPLIAVQPDLASWRAEVKTAMLEGKRVRQKLQMKARPIHVKRFSC